MGGGSLPAARAVTYGVLAGLVSALFLLLAHLGNLGAAILVTLAALPVFMAGLGAGLPALVTANIVGLGATIFAGGVEFGVLFFEQVALPTMVLVVLALARPVPPSARRLVLGLGGLGCGVFALVYLAATSQDGGLSGLLRQETGRALQEYQQRTSLPLPPEFNAVTANLPFWLTGAAITFWLLTIVINASLAQSVLTRFEWNKRVAPPMASLSLPWVTSVVFLAACAAGWYGSGQLSFIGANLAEILAVPLFLGGLAVVHMAARHYTARLFVLICIYAIMMTVWPAIIILVLGLIEQWVGLRRRMSAAKP